MKIVKYVAAMLILLAIAAGCKEEVFDDTSFVQTVTAPANITYLYDLTTDNSGNVTITPGGEGPGSYDVYFGDTTSNPANVLPGGKVIHKYAEGNYTVKIVGKGVTGLKTEKTFPLSVVYRAPENLSVTITKSVATIKVKASADFAKSFVVYYGDKVDEVGTPMAIGAELSHTYTSLDTFDVKVVALSGGAANTELITPVIITVPFVFPIDFESPIINYFFGTFGGGQKFEKVANPNKSGLNTSATVGMFTKGYEGWSGTYSPLDAPLDFAKGKKVKVWVYNPDPANIGLKMNVELESAVGGTPANGVAVLKMAFTTSGAWEELIFDFGTIAEIPAATKFNQLVLRFNDTFDGAGAVFYVDNFRLTK
jgi:hypothetical protein